MRKRNCRVQVRLDNKEYQGFMKAVRKSGLSQEVYLRHLINGVVPQDAPPPDYYHFMRELHGVGNNLNQIAQKAHVLGVVDELSLIHICVPSLPCKDSRKKKIAHLKPSRKSSML